MKKKYLASTLLPDEVVLNKIYLIRGLKVMLDSELAELYGVENKRLKEQVRRNMDRFPGDFMFELKWEEYDSLRSQFATLKRGTHSKYKPYVFTEHGVLMLSSILNSGRAIQVNIQIMRIFTRMREAFITNKEVLLQLEKLDRKVNKNDQDIQLIFEYVKQLLNPPARQRKRIGFKIKRSE